MTIILFLDDTREFLDIYNGTVYEKNPHIIVRDYEQFTNQIYNWCRNKTWPEDLLISFDHDLHNEHIAYYFNNGGHNNPPDPKFAKFKHKTGMDCAKYMLMALWFWRQGNPFPNCVVHSANPKGKINIEEFLKESLSFWDMELNKKISTLLSSKLVNSKDLKPFVTFDKIDFIGDGNDFRWRKQ